MGFLMCGCEYVGFCNVWECVCMDFVISGCVCMGFVKPGCVYVWFL